MKQIVAALKQVFATGNPARCMLEGMMKWDFKFGDQRQNLMQLCFANLAVWPVLVVAAVLAVLNPFRFQFSLAALLGDDSRALSFLLDGHNQNLLLFFALFFLVEWLFRAETVFVALVLFFMNRGELHVNLALASVFGIYLARICYLWWLAVDSESETRKIWSVAGLLEFVAWVFAFLAALYSLDWLQINHLFDGVTSGRLYFVTAAVMAFHGLAHLLLSVWGHFYFKKKADPSFLAISYSTSNWILRFPMSQRLQNILRKQIEVQLPKHQQIQQQFSELKGLNPGLGKLSVESVLKTETEYLKEALLRLNRI